MRILEDFGVRPDLTGGHSFGELTALCAAGRIDDRSLALLAQRRGAIMASCAEEGDTGAMLAVFAPLEQVSALLREHGLDLVIANKNAPRQCVLSGPAAEIERVQRLLADRGVDDPLCPGLGGVSQPGVASAEKPLREALDSIPLGVSAIPVFANATAEPYPDDPARPAPCWRASSPGRSSLSPRSRRCIEWGHAPSSKSAPTPSSRDWSRRILEGRDHLALAVDARADRRATCTIWPARSQPWPRLGMLSILLHGMKGATSRVSAPRKRDSP